MRIRAGLSTYQLAERLQISQSKISKIENARVAAAIDDVRAWATALGAASEEVELLEHRAELALTEAVAWRGSIGAGGVPTSQNEVGTIERLATRIDCYSPALIPGLLQVAEYARQVILAHPPAEEDVVSEAVAARLGRQQVLYDTTKSFRFVVPEAVFYWAPPVEGLMLAQIEHILSVSTLPNVDIGIVPVCGATWTWHTHGFNYFVGAGSGDLVHVETLSASLNVSDPEDLVIFRGVFAALHEAALHGGGAARHLRKIRSELGGIKSDL